MRLTEFFLVAPAVGLGLSALVVADNALHAPDRTIPPASAAEALAHRTGSTWADVSASAKDGVILRGWLFTPRQPNGAAVIALHGVADTRLGMLGHAEFLLNHGFIVLTPDSRGHGSSGGAILTYGVREADDIRRWADRLLQNDRVERLYGIGQSMGASILLESLQREPRFRAVVADCPFATFEQIAYERLQQVTGIPQPVFWPIVHLGFWYSTARYGVDLSQASPIEAVRATHTPILLIHGTADTNIPPHHSEELHAANPRATQLWLVPGAGHVASFSTNPREYTRRVIAWFDQ